MFFFSIPCPVQAGDQPPEAVFRLSAAVREQFTAKIENLPDADLRRHAKVVAFKDSISRALKEGNFCIQSTLLIIHQTIQCFFYTIQYT